MGEFLRSNAATIVIGLALLGIVAGIIRGLVKKARRGQCVGCAYAGQCAGGCHGQAPRAG